MAKVELSEQKQSRGVRHKSWKSTWRDSLTIAGEAERLAPSRKGFAKLLARAAVLDNGVQGVDTQMGCPDRAQGEDKWVGQRRETEVGLLERLSVW